jgi:eukaryotic-like serine/threonine-protein kinase
VLTRGDVLGGRYRLDEPIATGGMGEVWRATDQTLRRTVALKVLRTALLTDPVFDARFRAEARTMAALNHPNVVNIYDYGRSPVPEGDATYLVMAYVDGQPLSALIAQNEGLPVGKTLAVLAQAADALHAAHAHGIVHRDVKPANLLVRPDGTVVLVDFGVARSAELSSATTGNQVLGTALYMAPEQASGRGVSPATDIYALGAVGYHCLAGHPPFTGETPVEVALRHLSDTPPPLPSSVPPAVRSLVERALAKDPADRYPDAAAFASAARRTARTAGVRAAGRRTAVVAASVGAGPATAGAGTVDTAPPVDPPTLAELPTPVPAASPVPLADDAHPGRGRRSATVLACVLAVGLLVGVVGLLLHGAAPAGGGPAPADRPATVRPASPVTGAQPATQAPQPTATRTGPTGSAGPAATGSAPGAPAAATTTAPTPPATTQPPTPSRPPATSPAPATSAPPSPPPSGVPTADVDATTAPSVAAIPGATAAGSGSAGSGSAGSGSGSATTTSFSDSASASGNSPSARSNSPSSSGR